jgi:hypothetical protein
MHVLPLDLEMSPLAGNLSGSSGGATPSLEPDPLAISHTAPETLF